MNLKPTFLQGRGCSRVVDAVETAHADARKQRLARLHNAAAKGNKLVAEALAK